MRAWTWIAVWGGALALATPSGVEAQCGNGRLDGGELCDDGNVDAADGCDASCAIEPGFSCINPPRISGLAIEAYPGDSSAPAWSVEPNGLSGEQLANSNATVGRLGADAQAITYLFDIEVQTFLDDDWFGIVLGFEAGDTTNANADYLLLDWKQSDQAGALAGLVLSRVTGVPDQTPDLLDTDLWDHVGAVEILARGAVRGSTGWDDPDFPPFEPVSYRFEISYSPTNLTVIVDGDVEFDLDAPAGTTWPQGEIGFYGFSQQNVAYTVVLPPPSECGLDADDDGVFDRVDADSDGDGIPDAVELTAYADDPDRDDDDDGIPNWNDPDLGRCVGDGGTPARCASLRVVDDVDQDGRPNHLDRDADGDGLHDALEAGFTAALDADGRLAVRVDADRDGLADVVDSAPADPAIATVSPRPTNTDSSGPRDFLAADSDGDGLDDAVEAHDSNGDGVLAAPEAIVSGSDHDGDGIDDAFDGDCLGAGRPAGCAAAGRVVRAPYGFAEDSDGDGVPDWLQVCLDGYVAASEACDDGNRTDDDECSNRCLRGLGVDCTAPTECDSSFCNGALEACVPCADTVVGGVDDGCVEATPACVVGEAGARCEVCDDDQPEAAADDGCTLPAPLCDGRTNTCAECVVDPTGGRIDFGCTGSTPACDAEAPDGPACVPCVADDDCPGILACADRTCVFPDSDGDGLPDDVDIDDDGDGVLDVVEDGGVDLSDDDDGDGVPDYLDPDAVTCEPAPGLGRCAEVPEALDFDGDGHPNHADIDADGDGILDFIEAFDGDRDGRPEVGPPTTPADMDSDGLDDVYDPDAGGTEALLPDHDADGRTNHLDGDADDDGRPDRIEAADANRDGRPDILASGVDADGDGLDDAFAADRGGAPVPRPDADGDGVPDDLDLDSDGDGAPDELECPDPSRCGDADGDGRIDALDLDADGDGIPDGIERHDRDGDGEADFAPEGEDADRDGFDDGYDVNQGGVPAPSPDRDGDGVVDALDADDDGDGVPTTLECADVSACPDGDGDGVPDYLSPSGAPADSDGDGLPDLVECGGDLGACPDTDEDGASDREDADDDGDGVATGLECPLGADRCDPDGDGVPSHLDLDSDGDGVADGDECRSSPCADVDLDGTPDRLDLDADDDGIADAIEAHDVAGEGVPAVLPRGLDDDGDGLDDAYDADQGGVRAPLPDFDDDGVPDWRDPDDDGDGVPTSLECRMPAGCPDGDDDGIPDYLDSAPAVADGDGDGVPDALECPELTADGDVAACPDLDGDGSPDVMDIDDDDDGLLTRDEVRAGGGDPTRLDTDQDGRPDFRDADDDNDGVPTAFECLDPRLGCPDADGDGILDQHDVCGDGRRRNWDAVTVWEGCDDGNATLGDGCDASCRLEVGVPDTDGDGLSDLLECPAPGNPARRASCVDSDGDGAPDFDDPDDDGDGVPSASELDDGRPLDADLDGTPDHLDDDDDGDGVPTADELGADGGSDPRDQDGDGAPDYLDGDDDGDSLDTASELGPGGAADPRDTDGDGEPDYLDADDDQDGILTRQEVQDTAGLAVPNEDVDADLALNWLDPDADGDGNLDGDERGDDNENGVPDYLEATEGGLAGGATCGVVAPGSGGRRGWVWALALLALLGRRRRRD